MSSPRFFIPASPQGDVVEVAGEEARHIVKVRRLGEGDAITLFDATGAQYQGVIAEVRSKGGRPSVLVRIQSRTTAHREPAVKIVLATAIPKGERADFMVQKCAELGCHTLIPMECERSVVRFVPGREGKLQKWRRIALEASKQCGRNQIMEIALPQSFKEVLRLGAQCSLRIVCSLAPQVKPLKNLLAEMGHPKDIICLVGPEGGFTEEELNLALAAQFHPVTLARSVLRTETAGIAAVAIIAAEYL